MLLDPINILNIPSIPLTKGLLVKSKKMSALKTSYTNAARILISVSNKVLEELKEKIKYQI